jgi:hypothetical protein
LQAYLAGGALSSYCPQTVGYRPFLQLPPAYQPRENVAICKVFSSLLVVAVGAVGILTSFT